MKHNPIVLLALLAITWSANGELTFREVIDVAQAQSLALHQQMENEFDDLRERSSRHISTIAATSLPILVSAIDRVTEFAEQCPASLEPGQIEILGRELSACALSIDNGVYQLVTSFYDALEQPQLVSVGLLSSVLEQVSRVNGVDNPGQVATELNETLQTIRAQFTGEMVTTLRSRVADIEDGIAGVARIAQDCVDAVVGQIDEVEC